MAYNIYPSRSPLPPVLVVITWLLVFQFIVFKVYLTFVKAVILILKHATFLQLSESSKEALTHAELDYQKANIDLNVHQILASSEHSVKKFVEFIMATDIGSFILASVIIKSHQTFSAISVFSQHTCIEKMTSWNGFWEQICVMCPVFVTAVCTPSVCYDLWSDSEYRCDKTCLKHEQWFGVTHNDIWVCLCTVRRWRWRVHGYVWDRQWMPLGGIRKSRISKTTLRSGRGRFTVLVSLEVIGDARQWDVWNWGKRSRMHMVVGLGYRRVQGWPQAWGDHSW